MSNEAVNKKSQAQINREAGNARRLKPSNLHMAEYAYTRYCVEIPAGMNIKEMLDPEYWSHVSHKFQHPGGTGKPDQRGAIIEVRSEDDAVYAELYVTAVQERGVKVEILREHKIGPKLVASAKYNIRWNPGIKEHEIVRMSDKEVVFSSKDKTEVLAELKTLEGG